jgi:hypothetical protein
MSRIRKVKCSRTGTPKRRKPFTVPDVRLSLKAVTPSTV